MLFAVAVGAAAACVGYTMVRYPGVFDDPGAVAWTSALVVVFAVYAVAAVRGPGLNARTLGFGVVAAGLWWAEVWTQAPAGLPSTVDRIVPAACALAAAAVTIAAGVVTRGLAGGVWTGLVSGALTMVGMVVIQLANLPLLGARTDYRRELAQSGGTDMPTYLAGDAIAAGLGHMLLNPLLGLLGGAIGLAVARVARRSSTVDH